MLKELRIQDFAIIEKLELEFDPGFSVITGETGAGKSIIIDAVGLLLGGRADRQVVRAGAGRALVEGAFDLTDPLGAAVRPLLAREELEGDDADGLVVAREVRADGRSVCRINGASVRLALLRQIGERLVDIHGQSEHLSLLRPREHINLLDRYAELEAPRAELAGLVSRLEAVRRELRALLAGEAALASRIDLLQFQVDEIDRAAPRVGEDEGLREERVRLASAEKLAALADEARRALYDGDEAGASATDRLSQAAAALGKLLRIDETMGDQHDLAESLNIQAEDLARTLRAYRDSVEFSPARLDEVEERLDVLNRLKRKYGGTIEAVLEWRERARAELETTTRSGERVEELHTEEERLLYTVGQMSGELSVARRQAAGVLAGQVVEELAALHMEHARFEVSITHKADPQGAYVGDERLAFDATGVDRVRFLISANPGEPPRLLVRVASGGETSRLMLALKTVLSRADATPTLIFDEIDQGIGGRVGAVVGRKLWGLSDTHQVLVITHLAQLAGFGDAHYRVSKEMREGRTVAIVEVLGEQGRVDELAAMLGAETESARQSAFDILMMARRVKEGREAAVVGEDGE
jgi:DNA repair protein RecN (Recombination protein N)